MKIEYPICPVLFKGVKRYITDVQHFFGKQFVLNNYHKHFFISLALTIPSMFILDRLFDLQDTGTFFHLFVGGFGGYFVNGVKEWFYSRKYNAPWDQTDIHMGSYGGVIGALIYLFL